MKWGNLQCKSEIRTFVTPFLKRERICLLTHAIPTNGGIKIAVLVGRLWISSLRSRDLLLLRPVSCELDDYFFSFSAPQSYPEVWYGRGQERSGCLHLSPGDSPGKQKAELNRDPCLLHPSAQSIAGGSSIVAAVEGLCPSFQTRWQHSGIFRWNRFQLIKFACSGKSDFYSPSYYSRKFQFHWNILIFSQRNSNWSIVLLICSKWIRLYMVEVQHLGIVLVLPLTLAFTVYLESSHCLPQYTTVPL